MTELTQPITRERPTNAGGLGSIFDDNHEPGGLVTVAVGPYVERLPLGNSTVAQIRARSGPRFDIDPRTQAVLDGHEVGDDTVVRTGQVLMFVHKSGEKGCREAFHESIKLPQGFGVRQFAGAFGPTVEKRQRSAALQNAGARVMAPMRVQKLEVEALHG